MEPTQADLRVGLLLNGRYRITQQLGEGGMGLVYRGERVELGRPVAIKFLHSPYAHSARFVARFQREARAMSKLSHPYCVSVLDFGVHDNAPYIVMDFVTGDTLREVMDEGRIPARRALDILRQLLAGLSHAHGQGVVHRDIKPGNIMLGEATGLGDHVRIFDFGLAKLHDPELDGDPSVAAIVGTPAYMAPEQARAERVDERADLYAAGIVLFEMLSGRKPFQGGEAFEILCMQRDLAPPMLRAVSPEFSPELEALVSKALEKAPENRFQTAAEFVIAIETTPEWKSPAVAAPAAVQRGTEATVAADNTRALLTSDIEVGSSAGATTPHGAPAAAKKGSRWGLGMTATTLFLIGGVLWWRARPHEESVQVATDLGAELLAKTGLPALRSAPTEEQAAAPRAAPVQAAAPAVPPEPSAAAVDASDSAELSEAALAAADEELNDTREREVTLRPQASNEPKVNNVADVKKLIAKGKDDAAIQGIQQLRRQDPRAPLLPFLLGNLYMDKGWMSDSLAKYRETIQLSAAYRKNMRLQRDAIRALGSDKSHARARALLVRDIGKLAVPALKRASTSDASPVVRKRAAAVLKQITR